MARKPRVQPCYVCHSPVSYDFRTPRGLDRCFDCGRVLCTYCSVPENILDNRWNFVRIYRCIPCGVLEEIVGTT